MVGEILSQFTVRDYVILFGVLLAQIPFVVMSRYYKQTKIFDFALGAGIMICGSLSLLLTQFFFLHQLWMFIVANICFITTYYLLIHWQKNPRVLTSLITLIYLSIVGLILLYRLQKIQPVEPMVFGFEMLAINRKTGGVPDIGAVTSWQGRIIIGSAFLFLIDLFKILSAMIFLLVYFYTPLSYDTAGTRRNRWIMIITAALNLLHPVLIIGVELQWWTMPYIIFNLINASFLVLLAYVGMLYPETLSLSHVQAIRTLSLYHLLEEREREKDTEDYFLGMKSVMNYIDKIAELKLEGKL